MKFAVTFFINSSFVLVYAFNLDIFTTIKQNEKGIRAVSPLKFLLKKTMNESSAIKVAFFVIQL